MRKLAALFVLLWAVPAYANTIEITNGGVSMTQSWNFDTCVSGFGTIQTCLYNGRLMPSTLDGTTTLDFTRAFMLPIPLVINLTYAPITWNEETSRDRFPNIYEPFTMTGRWGDDDVFGRGTLFCCTKARMEDGYPALWVSFAFEPAPIISAQNEAVPEPASLWLMILGGLALLPFSLSRRVP